MSVIAIPKPLRDKLGDDAADSLIELFNKVEPDTSKIKFELSRDLATKADLMTEIGKVNERITGEIGKLAVAVEKSSKENIKWMFLFWIGQIAVIVAIIKFLIVK